MKFVKYKNGNYDVYIDLETGTKIRKNNLDFFEPEYPESMDVKITNKCDMGCPFCHENSKPDGPHGNIMGAKFIETLHPYTELAIGGGNPLAHPHLMPFLEKCKKLKHIPSMTVNQKHFMQDQKKIKYLVDQKLIYGLGVSLTNVEEPNFIETLKQYPNAVIHVIAGYHKVETLKKLYDKDLKILILGYKKFRRGENFFSTGVEQEINNLYEELPELIKHFKVISFDNLALEQLQPKRIMSEEEWNRFYMGDDGGFTMFIDLVKNTFSTSSTTPETDRHELMDDIKDMFNIIRNKK